MCSLGWMMWWAGFHNAVAAGPPKLARQVGGQTHGIIMGNVVEPYLLEPTEAAYSKPTYY